MPSQRSAFGKSISTKKRKACAFRFPLSHACPHSLRAVIPKSRPAARVGIIPAHARRRCGTDGIGGGTRGGDETKRGTGSDRAARSPTVAGTPPAAVSGPHHGGAAIAVGIAARSDADTAAHDHRDVH